MGAHRGKELRTIVCPKCESFKSKFLTSFEKHLVGEHKISTKDLWDHMNGGPVKCACGCGIETRWIGWWNGYSNVVNGHNASIYNIYSAEVAEEMSKKKSESLRGKTSWAKGLTKDTDERILERAIKSATKIRQSFDDGNREAWNKGLTKEVDERIAKTAKAFKEKFTTGELTPWAKGLSKKTDKRIANMAARVSLTMRQENIRHRLDAIKRLSTDEIKSRIESLGTLKVVDGLGEYINDAQKIIQVECVGCGEKFIGSLRSLQYGRCFRCYPGGSIAQENLAKWIEGLNMHVKRNDRSTLDNNLELDIHVPSKNIAVEYNGLYWHSHVNKSPMYHSNKTISSERAGIKLIHVFEDEWRQKQGIVKSIILSRLKLSQHNVGARKCVLKQITSQERREFFESNHLDGDTAATVAYGLFFQDVLVYAMSLRKPFHKSDKTMEVARCCPKMLHNVPGGLSRLISIAKIWCKDKGIVKLMTYVDTRLGGTGIGYIKAGFKETNKTPPRFWWTDFVDRFNRFKFKADSKNGLTEAAVAEAAGVVKIWGCENIVYEMKIMKINS